MNSSESIADYWFDERIFVANNNAAIRDKMPPNIKGAKTPILSHKKPAITLAGSKAIPTRVEWRPSIVPFKFAGAISAIKARSAPAVIAV